MTEINIIPQKSQTEKNTGHGYDLTSKRKQRGVDKRKWVFRNGLARVGENALEAWQVGGWSQGGVEGYPGELG